VTEQLRRFALQWPIVEPRAALATVIHAPAQGALEFVTNAASVDTLDLVRGAFRTNVLHGETFTSGEPHWNGSKKALMRLKTMYGGSCHRNR
jgi:hypothetical protein